MNNIVSDYEALSILKDEMRALADRGEWDRLIELEQQCDTLVARLQANGELPVPDDATRLHQIRLIKKILADDEEIRQRTVAWMSQLERIMQSNRQELRINRAYGKTA